MLVILALHALDPAWAGTTELDLTVTPSTIALDAMALTGADGDFVRDVSAGDVDGDGVLDLMVGARRGAGLDADGEVLENAGRVLVVSSADLPSEGTTALDDLAWVTWLGSGYVGSGRNGVGSRMGTLASDERPDVPLLCAPDQTSDRRGGCFALVTTGEADVAIDALDKGSFYFDGDHATGTPTLGTALGAGDLDGDGWSDIVLGAEGVDRQHTATGGEDAQNIGAAYVLFGDSGHDWRTWTGTLDPESPGDAHVLALYGEVELTRLGHFVSALPDLNEDGIEELMVLSAMESDCVESEADPVVWSMFYGGLALADATAPPTLSDADLRFRLPCGLISPKNEPAARAVSPGDLDGDGAADLVLSVSARRSADDSDADGPGSIWIFYGPLEAWSGDVNLLNEDALLATGRVAWIDGEGSADGFGWALSALGDVNGDGNPDLAIGAPEADSEHGAVYLLLGHSARLEGHTTIDATDGVVVLRSNVAERLGSSVAGEDLDGDGRQELLVGASEHDIPEEAVDAGRIIVVFGAEFGMDGDMDGDGVTREEGDCDDGDASAYPGGAEGTVGDGRDNDCDEAIDEGTEIYDDDGDGYSEADGDCDDADAERFPQDREPGSADGVDDDCDGLVDEDAVAATGDTDSARPDDTSPADTGEGVAADKRCGCGSRGAWLVLLLAPGITRRRREKS